MVTSRSWRRSFEGEWNSTGRPVAFSILLSLVWSITMSLSDQLKNFKKSMSASTLVGVKRTATQSTSAADAPPTPKYGGITNNTRAAFESSQPHPKKKTKKAPGTWKNERSWNCTAYPYYRPFCNVVVYSQPANTGTGQHLMSQLYTVIQFLKVYPYNLDVLFERKLLARTFGISVRTYYVGTWYSTINHQHSFPHRRRYCQQRWALGQTCT